MIVIGVDTHKRSHTLVAVDAATGGVLGERTVSANDDGALVALRLVAGLGDERVWAIEDCRHVSGRFERSLVAAGERVIRIPPALTANARRSAREPGKSDRIDALAVAHTALREASSGSRQRSLTSRRWRFACSATTATSSSLSAPG